MSKGFVIALVILLAAAILISRGMTTTNDGRNYKLLETRAELEQIALGSRTYFRDYGTWPKSMDDLTNNPKRIRYANLDVANITDAWGNPVQYHPYDDSLGYGSVVSLGADGKSGGFGRNKDIEIHFNQKWDADRDREPHR